MTAQSLTLVGALVAAAAGISAAIVSSMTARRVATETAIAALQREVAAFRRQRVATMTDLLFENAIALQTLSSCCHSVPWLTKTPMEEIHERGELHIARIQYAAQSLRSLNEILDEKLSAFLGLHLLFHSFCNALYFYKQQITLMNIEPSGQANTQAKDAENRMLSASKDWGLHIHKLRAAVTEIAPPGLGGSVI